MNIIVVDRFSPGALVPSAPPATSAAIADDDAGPTETQRRYIAELQAHNEELDAFVHTVAHALKNPLGLIIGFAEVLGEDGTTMPDEELRHYLWTIARTGRKMKRIIDELLLLAGACKMEVEIELLDTESVVAKALQRLAPLIEEYQADIILPDTWPAALGYGPWVEEVWVNYLSNAIKYGGRPPRAELGTSPPSIRFTQERSRGGQVGFRVRDNGLGISPAAQGRVFTPFTRLDPDRAEGHGLGLFIVRRIVERLGGQVAVGSQVGQGSVFAFTLPGVQVKGRGDQTTII